MTPADMNKWIKSMRKKHPHWTYVYIPQAHDDMVSYDPKNGPITPGISAATRTLCFF